MKHMLPSSEPRYAPIITDKVFKLILGERANKDILIELLNTLIPDKHIVDLIYLDKEHHGFVFQDKSSIFDVYCETEAGEKFVVEMQGQAQDFFADRVLFYAAYPIREQIVAKAGPKRKQLMARLTGRKKQMDYSLTPIYMVSITNFAMPHHLGGVLEDGLVSRYSIRDDHAGELMTGALHFVFFEIGRLPYKIGEEGKCSTRLQKIACAMRYMQDYQEVTEALRKEILVERMFEASRLANMTVKQRKYYDKQIMETWIDRQAQLAYASREGREKGIEEGRAEGEAIGAAQRNVEIAQAMLAKGFDTATIQEITGLTPEEIEHLKEN